MILHTHCNNQFTFLVFFLACNTASRFIALLLDFQVILWVDLFKVIHRFDGAIGGWSRLRGTCWFVHQNARSRWFISAGLSDWIYFTSRQLTLKNCVSLEHLSMQITTSIYLILNSVGFRCDDFLFGEFDVGFAIVWWRWGIGIILRATVWLSVTFSCWRLGWLLLLSVFSFITVLFYETKQETGYTVTLN